MKRTSHASLRRTRRRRFLLTSGFAVTLAVGLVVWQSGLLSETTASATGRTAAAQVRRQPDKRRRRPARGGGHHTDAGQVGGARRTGTASRAGALPAHRSNTSADRSHPAKGSAATAAVTGDDAPASDVVAAVYTAAASPVVVPQQWADPTPPAPVGPLPASVDLTVPAVDQWPTLPNGCEVTALSMLLDYEGIKVSNVTLAGEIARAKTPRQVVNGQTVRWGDPNNGFVGSMRDFDDGYGVYNGPIAALASKYLGTDVDDQTGCRSRVLWDDLASGRPVVVWTNVWFEYLPSYDWETWQSDHGPITASMEEHAVLLVGYSAHHVYVNNPENGDQSEAVPMSSFLASWRQFGRQAVTVNTNLPTSMAATAAAAQQTTVG
jgi:uncharacterized protein YvpB